MRLLDNIDFMVRLTSLLWLVVVSISVSAVIVLIIVLVRILLALLPN